MIATIIILLLLIAIVAFVIVKIIKDRRQGKSSCDGNCSGCSYDCSDKGGSAE